MFSDKATCASNSGTTVPLESARNSLHNPILEYNGQNKKIDFSKTKSLKSFNLTELIFYK